MSVTQSGAKLRRKTISKNRQTKREETTKDRDDDYNVCVYICLCKFFCWNKFEIDIAIAWVVAMISNN